MSRQQQNWDKMAIKQSPISFQQGQDGNYMQSFCNNVAHSMPPTQSWSFTGSDG